MNVPFGTAPAFPSSWLSGGLIDPVSGIISGVWEQPREAGHADLFQYAAMASNTGAFGGPENFRHTGGASLDRRLAWAKAVGEAIERYCAAIYETEDYPLCSRAAASFPTIDPAQFSLYPDELTADSSFPMRRFDDDTPLRWCPAETLDGQSTHVPAAAVHIPWHFEPGDTQVFQPISTGLACHGSIDRARLGGLMEVVERDAFTLLWQSSSALAEIQLEHLPDDIAEIVRRIRATGAEVRGGFADTDHGIPVCVVTQTIDSDLMPAFALAAAAAPTAKEALRKALEELVHTFRWMARLQATHPDFDPGTRFENVIDQETHLLFWCDRSRRHLADFLWSGPHAQLGAIPELSAAEPSVQLREAVRLIERTGYKPLFVDLTTEDVAPFGFRVIRALVPGFNPLFMGHALRSRTNPRLLARLAQCDDRVASDIPHPFP